MSGNFFTHLNPIIQRINSIHSRRMTAYVHCSKINNCIQALKQIPPIIYEVKLQNPNKLVNDDILERIHELTVIFSKLEDLFIQCCSTNCFQFLLSSPVGDVKRELKRLRNTSAVLFTQLDIPEASQILKISDESINSQDFVDMKRIAQMLIKLSQQNRKDAEDSLKKRFHSLDQMGISTNQVELESINITIPPLPSNLQIIIPHNDIELGREIGVGQTGVVRVGVIKSIQQTVAVKVILKKTFTQPEFESFKREIYTLSVVSNPNLLNFYGYTNEPPFCIITEYLPNGSLYDVLHKSPSLLTPTKRSVIAADVAQGLVYLHSKGIIHRDMKSLNVLLDDHFRAKICDFGMVQTRNAQQPMTGLIGTAHWMAPEVLMSTPTYDDKIDVYSFGIILWEILTGKVPYGEMSTANIAIFVVEQGLRPDIPENAPPRIRDLMTRCWNANPLNRPTMIEVLKELMTPECHFPNTNEARFQEAESGAKALLKSLGSKSRMIRSNTITTSFYSSNKVKRGSNVGEDKDEDTTDEYENFQRIVYLSKANEEDSARIAVNSKNILSSFSRKSSSITSSSPHFKEKRHSSFTSKESAKLDGIGMNVESLVASLQNKIDSDHLTVFCDLLENKKFADEAAAAGGNKVIVEVLTKQKKGTSYLIEKLEKCRSPQIFDTSVIKALLSFSDSKRQSLRDKALSALIVATELRLDFLKSYPSFLSSLLGFLKEQPQSSGNNSANNSSSGPNINLSPPPKVNHALPSKLLTLAWKLIIVSEKYPENIIPILMWYIDRPETTELVASCIVACMRFEQSHNELTKDNISYLLRNVDRFGQIIDEFIKSSKKTSKNDEIFIKLLFKGKMNKKIYDFIPKVAGSKRFVMYVIENLPLKNDMYKTVNVYNQIISNFIHLHHFRNKNKANKGNFGSQNKDSEAGNHPFTDNDSKNARNDINNDDEEDDDDYYDDYDIEMEDDGNGEWRLTNLDFFNDKLSHIPEFYSAAAYMIGTQDQLDPICTILMNIKIDYAAVSSTKLPRVLADEIVKRKDSDQLLLLMAASFSILKVLQASEFVSIVHRFEYFLQTNDIEDYTNNFSTSNVIDVSSDQKKNPLKMPSFLCLAAISNFSPSSVNYQLIVPVAAYFVNVDSILMRETSAIILCNHISDPNVDLNLVFKTFVDNFNEKIVDDSVKAAVLALSSVCHRSEISKDLLKEMSRIYSTIRMK